MFRFKGILKNKWLKSVIGLNKTNSNNVRYMVSTTTELPASADVVIIGGGSAGCHTLYHLTKRGVKAVLLERAKLTAGTTWHTAGLIWRLRTNDVEIQLLASTRNLLMSLEEETGINPGWIMNGSLFIAHSDIRLDEYKRLSTIGKCYGVESHIISPEETQKIFPLLDPSAFTGALYSPGDGVVDPAMLCAALTRAATNNGGQIFEECPVLDLEVGQNLLGVKDVRGVVTPFGTIKTNTIINATGVWGKDLVEKYNITLPLIPMRHAYVVSETIDGVKGMPNVRDHDYSLYFRIQGQSICMGGYENNPTILNRIPKDFQFGLYNLDWSVFDTHIQGAIKLCPTFGMAGIKSTICGPESFTPDHKPLMGPDPRLDGLFHNCAFNSAGMMLGGGCGEQIAEWVIHGRPSLYMFNHDIRRFTPKQTQNTSWATERSYESYAQHGIAFPNDQPLAGRNLILDPLHQQMLQNFAVMEEKHGWERPAYFLKECCAEVQPYDWNGSDGHKKNVDRTYEEILKRDLKFDFSDNHNLIGEEANACRNNAVVFNISYFGKLFLTGTQAQEAASWIFTGDTTEPINKTIYTCALNDRGGVEADVTITAVESGNGESHDPVFNGRGFYIVTNGAPAYHTLSHIKSSIQEKGFQAKVTDVTTEMGIISIQGPKSRDILQKMTDFDLSMEPNSSSVIDVKLASNEKQNVRILRFSTVGELGYELHIPKDSCEKVYNTLMAIGGPEGLRNAGFRALNSLGSEKGYHLWGHDLRTNDTPIEANLEFTCRKNGLYNGKDIVEKQKCEGICKKMVYFTLAANKPIWGKEAVHRNGIIVGFIRRGEYAYTLQKSFGQAYIQHPEGNKIDEAFLRNGKYQIEIMGELHDATCYLQSPFDPQNKRFRGIYNDTQ